MLGIEAAGPVPELKSKSRPERRVVTMGIEVPAGTPRGPYGTLHPPLYLIIEYFLNLRSHLDGPQFPSIHGAHTTQDI